MPCKRRACSFWRRCSSCSDRSASIPRKSKWWLEDVEGAGLHGPIRTKRIILRLQTAVNGVEGATTATDAAHDAVAAVPGVDSESGDLCRSQKRPPIGRVCVLAGLQPPLQSRRGPDLLPERHDPGQRVIAAWVEQPEGKVVGCRDVT